VALVKPGRSACWNHATNSFSAMLYTRFVIGEETLSSTIPSISATARSFPLQSVRSLKVLLMGINGQLNITSCSRTPQAKLAAATSVISKLGHLTASTSLAWIINR
jgi:hypothetical protein